MNARADNLHATDQLSYWAELLSEKPPRNLSLLRSIENAISTFRRWQDFIELFTRILKEEGDKLLAKPKKAVLDTDGSVQTRLLNAQKSLKTYHEQLATWCEKARSKSVFDEDEIIDECAKLASSISELHNYLNSIRWAIAEHDADFAKKTGSFKTVDELIGHLENQKP